MCPVDGCTKSYARVTHLTRHKKQSHAADCAHKTEYYMSVEFIESLTVLFVIILKLVELCLYLELKITQYKDSLQEYQ